LVLCLSSSTFTHSLWVLPWHKQGVVDTGNMIFSAYLLSDLTY
jgi:hypothetical protein